MTADYVNLELAAKRGNPSVVWRSGQERQPWPGWILNNRSRFYTWQAEQRRD